MLDLIFDKALPGAITELAKQIKQVQLWVEGDVTLNPQAMVKELQGDLCTLTAELCGLQQQRLEEFAISCSQSEGVTITIETNQGKEEGVGAVAECGAAAAEGAARSAIHAAVERAAWLTGLSPEHAEECQVATTPRA